jgi:Zn-dependent protease with chaperone function
LRAETTSAVDAELRAGRLFALSIGLGACGAVAVGIALRGVESVRVTPGARVGHFVVLGQSFSYPDLNAAAAVALALAGLGAVVLGLGLHAAVRELRSSLRFARMLRGRTVRRIGEVCVFEEDRPQAFCAGLVRPRVYLSAGAARQLPEEELRAVLAHEWHHRDRRDPLRIAVGRVLARAMFFMPVLVRLHRRYCAIAELAADDAAIRADGGSPTALASAMLVFEDATHPAASVGIAPERVDHMLGRDQPARLPVVRVAGALATTALIALAAWQVGGTALARATFNLPLLSTQPCIVSLALVPGLVGTLAVRYLRAAMA